MFSLEYHPNSRTVTITHLSYLKKNRFQQQLAIHKESTCNLAPTVDICIFIFAIKFPLSVLYEKIKCRCIGRLPVDFYRMFELLLLLLWSHHRYCYSTWKDTFLLRNQLRSRKFCVHDWRDIAEIIETNIEIVYRCWIYWHFSGLLT